MRDALEALFFNTGHYADGSGGDSPMGRSRIAGWPAGTVPIRVENAPDNERATVAHVGEQSPTSQRPALVSTMATPTTVTRTTVFIGSIRVFTVGVGEATSLSLCLSPNVKSQVARDIRRRGDWRSDSMGFGQSSSSVNDIPAGVHDGAQDFPYVRPFPHLDSRVQRTPTGFGADFIMRSPLPRTPAIEFSPIEMELIRQVTPTDLVPAHLELTW